MERKQIFKIWRRILTYILPIAAGAALFTANPAAVSAHPLNNGYSQIQIDGRKIDYELFLPDPDLLMFDTNGDKRLAPDELAVQRAAVEAYLQRGLKLKSGGSALDLHLTSINADDKEGIPGETFKLTAMSAYRVEQLSIDYELLFDDTDPLHVNFAVIMNGGDLDQAVFDSRNRTYTYTEMNNGGLAATLLQYVWLGVLHIWTGYDHLLFLLCLLAVCAGWRDAVGIVTSFTAAHTVTLGLTAAGILRIDAVWVECGIALTIAYVAAENWFVPNGGERLRRYRWLLTLGFGLIHGMGFAGALLETGLPEGAFLPSLLSFNAGIELGQIIVLALTLPILLKLKKRMWYPRAVKAFSAVVFLLALFWAVQRAGWLGL